MADPEVAARLEALEAKINSLHEALTAQGAKPVRITAEDMQAFNKVRDALANPAADWGDFCGINDCFRPPIVTACGGIRACFHPCIFECTCGPCGPINPAIAGGLGRFGQFA